MSECAVMSGVIPPEGVVELLRAIEAQRTTGELRFASDDVEGAVRLDAGQLAFDQKERLDGKDVIEVLLALRSGRFDVVQLLPELPVTQGDRTSRRGSLGIHAPADLMNHAERSGLTGVLTLEHRGQRARVLYDRGELVGIAIDGVDAGIEVQTVFGWSDGSFTIEAHRTASSLPEVTVPAEPKRRSSPTLAPRWVRGAQSEPRIVRVVEMRLAQLLDEARERRPKTVPPPPSMAVATRSVPPNAAASVRVILLGGNGEMLLRREDLAAGNEAAFVRRERTGPTTLERVLTRVDPRRSTVEAGSPDRVLRIAIVAIVAFLLLGLAAFVATLVDVP